MTTNPVTGDAFGAMSRADGTTVHHSDDHGNVIDITVNAKKYLRGDGVTESSTQLDLFAAACSHKAGFFPPGTYKFPDGYAGLATSEGCKYYGAGNRSSIITVKDGYAFVAASGDQFNSEIAGLGVTLRSGSTSGGGINLPLNTHGGWLIHNVEVLGVDTNLTPLFYIRGFTGSTIDRCRIANNGGTGIYMDNTNVGNAWSLKRSSINANCIAGTTYAGLHMPFGSGGGTISDNDFESNRGYGIYYDNGGGQGYRIHDNWFEENWNHDVFIADADTFKIQNNNFEGLNGANAAAGARNIKITESLPTRRNYHIITGNMFSNVPPAGVNIEIGTNVSESVVAYNRGCSISGGTITDNGTRTRIEGNDNGGPDDLYIPIGSSRAIRTGTKGVFRIKGDSQTGDDGDPTSTGIFSVMDAAGEESFSVTRKGYAVYHTPNGDSGTGQLPTNAFLFYWDEGSGKVMVRYRTNGGATSTAALF